MLNPFFDPFSDFEFFGLLETEEVKKKRKELKEAKERAYEEIVKREERPLPLLLAGSEEKFRDLLEKYAKEHQEEKVTGVAFDRPNLTYRALRIVKKE